MKQIIIGVLAVIVIIGGAVVFGKDKEAANGTPSNNFYGQEQATVTLIEYGDFECSACAAFHPIVSQIKEEYKDQIRFEFRHFPLVQIHFNAQAAHRAAQAAANQGKFWEMHDLLYERQASWSANVQQSGNGGPVASNNNPGPIFEGYAQELGLDIEQFKTDVASGDTLGIINSDVDLGGSDGVTGTPTFVLNGKKIDDTATVGTVEGFRALIDEALGINNSDDSEDSESSDDHADDTHSDETPHEDTPEASDESTDLENTTP